MVEIKYFQSVGYEGMTRSRIKLVSKEFLRTILVMFFLITPEYVSGSATANRICTRAMTPISVQYLFECNRIPRGGGIRLGRSKNSKGSVYLQALDDEIVYLEQQLRRVEEQKRSLKKKMAKRQQIREDLLERSVGSRKVERGKAKGELEQQDEDLLRLANLEQLEKQKVSLQTARKQLEAIKADYDEKINALQSDISKSTSKRKSLEKAFLARVKELETSLRKVREAAANPKIHDPELSRKIDEACRAAITEFWVDGNRKLEEHERRLKARNEQDLLEERRLASLAVEKQRLKMRALARAMALREKEISIQTRKISRQLSQKQPKTSEIHNQGPKPRSIADKNQDEKLAREKLKAIREEAERKAKEEEERMWLELENELQLERERLQRMKQREEEERRRCEQEELERQRLLQQHVLDMQERLRQEQINAAANENGSGSNGDSFFQRLFTARKKKVKTPQILEPTVASIENYQRRVVWQPISLPPKEAVRITAPSSGS